MILHNIMVQGQHKGHRALLVMQDVIIPPSPDKGDVKAVSVLGVPHKTQAPKQT